MSFDMARYSIACGAIKGLGISETDVLLGSPPSVPLLFFPVSERSLGERPIRASYKIPETLLSDLH